MHEAARSPQRTVSSNGTFAENSANDVEHTGYSFVREAQMGEEDKKTTEDYKVVEARRVWRAQTSDAEDGECAASRVQRIKVVAIPTVMRGPVRMWKDEKILKSFEVRDEEVPPNSSIRCLQEHLPRIQDIK